MKKIISSTMKQIKILAICGSLRAGSYNRKLLAVAQNLATEAGAQVEEFDLKVAALPEYNQDIEDQGFPGTVKEFKTAVENTDLLLIATPEYNRSISGALKNAIDWLSRGRNSLEGKVAAIMGASTGPIGTIMAQFHLRQILANLGVLVIPKPMILVRFADKAFNPDGSLVDKKTEELLSTLVANTAGLVKKLRA
jgi:chromate reductase, NAD(P)H dehydrogenase (quinone)